MNKYNFFIHRWGYIIHYLFHGILIALLVIHMLNKAWITSEVLYFFFLIAGMYAGSRISFYCCKHIHKEAKEKQ